jgi:hypothetical protein
MILAKDFEEFISLLNTGELDIWIEVSDDTAQRMLQVKISD